jgi:hypothetical protein
MGARTPRSSLAALLLGFGLFASASPGALAATIHAANADDLLLFADGFETGDTSVWGLPHVVWLPPGTEGLAFHVEFAPVDALADLVFSVDTTGSMGGEITNLQNGLSGIAAGATALVADTNFAVASWRDFPIDPFGTVGDLPWQLLQGTTSNLTSVQNAIQSMAAGGGGTTSAESGYEALYQLASGAGVTWPPSGSVPPFPGPGLGGVGFRAGAQPLAIHVTDATSQDASDYGSAVPDAHSKSQAFAALEALGVRVLTVFSGTEAPADTQALEIATATGARVPPCGFSDPRPAGCAAGQCCTGINGAGEAVDLGGQCPLRFRTNSAGAGLGAAVVSGLEAVIRYAPRDVVSGASDPAADGPDTTCFIDAIEADAYFPPPEEPAASCVPVPTPADVGGSGYDDGFTGFATGASAESPGSRLRFIVRASNDCVASIATVQSFAVHLNLADAATGALLDHVVLTVLIPPTP